MGKKLLGLAGVTAIGVGIAAFIRGLLAAPRTPPAFDGPRPVPAEDGYISHTESIVIEAPRALFRDWADRTELEDLGLDSQNLPSVVRTELIKGSWDPDTDRVGARRRVVLDDGHFAAEEILVDNPDRFRYEVWGYTNFGKLMVDHAIGEFRYAEDGSKTVLTWTYSFRPRSALVRPALSMFVSAVWADFMRNTLEAMRVAGERNAREAERARA